MQASSPTLKPASTRRTLALPSHTDTTLALGQALPLTAKLSHQQAVALGQHDVAQREADVRRLEIYGEITGTFIAFAGCPAARCTRQ
jgi:hypothetical protein